jgi:biotin carboxyl carrier protein
MKYFVEVDDRTIELDFQEEDGLLKVLVGGRHLSLDLRQVSPPSLYSLLIDNKSYDVLIEGNGENYDVLIGPEMFHLKVQDEWARRLANIQRKTQVDSGHLAIKAPMPGAVVAVEVAPGQEIRKGQGLVILSAMKMQNEIKSPRAGKVARVDVQAGQTVEQGRTLVVIE